MESWIQHILLMRKLSLAMMFFTLSVISSVSHAQLDDYDEEEESKTVLDAVVNPDIKRRQIKENRIDSENIELGTYGGVMSIEDFGTNNVFGVRAAVHFSEDWFIEANYGTTEAGQSADEISIPFDRFGNESRALTYTNISFGINVFPGEIYIGRNYAFNTNYYVIGGVGNTEFANDEYLTYNFGGGFKVFITDWFALNIDFRNHLFTHNIFVQEKSVQNLESYMGFSLYF